MNIGRAFAVALILVIGFLVLNPTFWLLFGSFWSSQPGAPGHLTLANYVAALTSADNYSVLLNSAIFAFLSTVIAFALGIPLAWIVTATNTPFRSFFEIVSLIPYLIPGLVFAIGWILLTSPTIGSLNQVLVYALHLRSSPLNIYSMLGMSWLGGLWSASVVYLIISASLKSWDTSLDEVASVAGASFFRRFLTVTLPTIRPALVIAAILVFVRMLEDFLFPAMIGLPARIHTYPTQIYGDFEGLQYGLATASSVVLFAIVGVLFLFYSRTLRARERFATTGGRGFATRIRDIGRWRYLAISILVLYLLFAAVLPMLVVVLASFVPIFSLSSLSLGSLTTKFYTQVFTDPTATSSLVNSTLLAVGAATLSIAISGLVGYMNARPSRARLVRLLGTFSILPIAFPGIVLAMGLLWGYIFVKVGIYGTIWILLVAYVTRFLPYSERSVNASFAQLNLEIDDAAATSGGGVISRLWHVILPMIRPGLASAWVIVVANSISELSASVILYTSNSEVAGVETLQLYNYNALNELSAISVILTVILLILSITALRLGRSRSSVAQS